MRKAHKELWEIRGRGKTLFSQELVKLVRGEPYICAECGKELWLPLRELKELCLLQESELKKKKFKGLCPECTRKWLEKQQETKRGYNVVSGVMDSVGIKEV